MLKMFALYDKCTLCMRCTCLRTDIRSAGGANCIRLVGLCDMCGILHVILSWSDMYGQRLEINHKLTYIRVL